MNSRFLTILKVTSLLIGLAMIAALVGCSSSSSSSNNPPPTVSVSLSSFPTALFVASTAQITATVSNDSTNAGVNWSCAPANSCGSFSSNSSASGTAVTYTAPASVPSSTVVITATSVASNSATASTSAITISVGLADGNYVFSLSGMDSRNSGQQPYFYVGAFTVASGAITGGEQDYIDEGYDIENTGSLASTPEPITSGTLAPSGTAGDSNLTITLNFTDSTIANGSGSVVLNANIVSPSKALLTEYDGWASGSGELDLQSTSLAAPTGAYAFATGGVDGSAFPISMGGVANVDGSGTISGTGSILDLDDDGNAFGAQAVTASTVTGPDSFGKVTVLLNTSCTCISGAFQASVRLDGYMVDASHIRVIENWYNDDLTAVTGGTMLAQTGAGSFSTGSVSGTSYVIGNTGADGNGALDVAGILSFGSGAVTMSGNLSFNDITTQTAQGGNTIASGSYAVDPTTGDVTITGLTDGSTFNYNLQLYLTGDGHALVIALDSNDVQFGYGWQQSTSSLTPASLSGSYSFDLSQITGSGGQQDNIGAFTGDGSGTLTGYIDQNLLFNGGSVAPFVQISAAYATTPTNGDFTVTDNGGNYSDTAYLVDGTKGVVIENDPGALSLGYFELQ